MLDDELFICSRLKHLIVIRGRNLYPHDIELVVDLANPAVRPGCTAAFHHETDEGEVLVIVSEVVEDADHEEVAGDIRRAIVAEFDVNPEVLLVGAWAVPKTTSGKLQREAARRLWLEQRDG
jgi:acyl-CoA synthetase (AMP-forming)/AMP-acid ligase II